MEIRSETRQPELKSLSDFNLYIAKITEYLGENHLDIGCGEGSTTFSIKKQKPNTKITGYDPDQSLIDLANKKNNLSQIDLTNKNQNLPQINFISNKEEIGNNKFDSASAIFVYHEVDDDIFKTASKFLIPGSSFTIVDYDLKDIGIAKFEEVFNSIGEEEEAKKMGWRDACLLHTRIGLKECIKDATKFGFKTIESKKINDKYFFWAGQKI